MPPPPRRKRANAVRKPVEQADKIVPARHVIERPGEEIGVASVICEGWATSTAVLPDGRRQTLAILLPGEITSARSIFNERSSTLVESVTETLTRRFDRSALRDLSTSHTDILHGIVDVLLKEQDLAAAMMVDLGCRTAAGRISAFILRLRRRLRKRGLANGFTFGFPLRQQHIADALGLTTVHISKVMNEFRRAGWIELKGRSLKILDAAQLKRVADM